MILHYIDISLFSLYFLGVFIVGFFSSRNNSPESYMLMGRRMTLAPFVMTLVSTWYGGILGVSEYSYTYGISNWVIFGLPYYVFGLVFALFVAKRAHRLRVSSLPEIIHNDYGQTAGILASVWVIILSSPAPYILTLGFLLNYFTGLPLVWGVLCAAIFSWLYIARGGLSAVVKTDVLQFIFMFVGFAGLIVSLNADVMSLKDLWQELPAGHKSLTGGANLAYILVWFFIGSWTLVDPGFHQRVYAVKHEASARNGILLAIMFWFLFDLLTTLTGLYAFILLPQDILPSQAFLHIANEYLAPGMKGLFYIGILATVMSTLDSNTLVSGITLGKDILRYHPHFTKVNLTRLIQVSMALILVSGALFALWVPSVVDLWYTFGTLTIPALLLPTLASIIKRPIPAIYARFNLWIPPLASGLWFLFGKQNDWSYYFGLEPFYPGLFTSMAIWGLSILKQRRT